MLVFFYFLEHNNLYAGTLTGYPLAFNRNKQVSKNRAPGGRVTARNYSLHCRE